jgi:hypothetical protein
MTFDLLQTIPGSVRSPAIIEGSLNGYFEVEGFICLKDVGTMAPAEFVPEPIADAFRDGAPAWSPTAPTPPAPCFGSSST